MTSESEEQPMRHEVRASKAESGDAGWWRVCAAEALGTALLVLVSCLPPPSASAETRALAAGLTVTMLVQCFDHISGAMYNPVVLLAAVMSGRVGAVRGALVLGAQLLGAVVGAAVLRAGDPVLLAGALTLPAPALWPPVAAALEALLGGLLALANCSSWDARNKNLKDSWPLRIGATVAGLALVAGPLTGASMNPARSFGPALLSGHFAHHWVYWVGPLGGSLVCTALYRAVWAPPAPESPTPRPPPSYCTPGPQDKPPRGHV